MFTKIIVGSFAVLGLIVATLAASQKSEDCCSLKLACCTKPSACCAADEKLGCCEKGQKCCAENKSCCAAIQKCCSTGAACCEVAKACCGPAAKLEGYSNHEASKAEPNACCTMKPVATKAQCCADKKVSQN